jgi:hypothetical protein
MLHGPIAAHRTLVQYLAEIRAGRSPDSLAKRLNTALPDVNQRIAHHFQHWHQSASSPAAIAMRNNA